MSTRPAKAATSSAHTVSAISAAIAETESEHAECDHGPFVGANHASSRPPWRTTLRSPLSRPERRSSAWARAWRGFKAVPTGHSCRRLGAHAALPAPAGPNAGRVGRLAARVNAEDGGACHRAITRRWTGALEM